MAKAHVMTSARRAALKRAQAASARKRRGRGKGKLAAANRRYDSIAPKAKKRMRYNSAKQGAKRSALVVGGTYAAVGAGIYAYNKSVKYRQVVAAEKIRTRRAQKRNQAGLRAHYQNRMRKNAARTRGLPVGRSHGNRVYNNRGWGATVIDSHGNVVGVA